MQGNILAFYPETNTGLISGHDGTRYTFTRSSWTNTKVEPTEGMTVDFDVSDKQALDIIVLKGRSTSHKRTKNAALLWALFLGGVGAHKFYLGKPGWGILYLLFCWTGVPVVIALIEFVILLLTSESDFNRKYNYS